MSDIAIYECERPWSYHHHHEQEYNHNPPTAEGVERARQVIDYIKAHPGCNRYDLLRNCSMITSHAGATTILMTISSTDCELYEDDDARLYYGGVR